MKDSASSTSGIDFDFACKCCKEVTYGGPIKLTSNKGADPQDSQATPGELPQSSQGVTPRGFHFRQSTTQLPSAMPSRLFPKPWTDESIPSGCRVIDENGVVLAHVYGQPDGDGAAADSRLTNDEARRIAKLISRLPELVEVERDRNRAKSRSHSDSSR
jgi:hypothetical protein